MSEKCKHDFWSWVRNEERTDGVYIHFHCKNCDATMVEKPDGTRWVSEPSPTVKHPKIQLGAEEANTVGY